MRAIDFPEANLTLVKPASMTDEQCYSISAYKDTDSDGYPFVLTLWVPNKEDLEALNAGRPLYLKVLGHQPPPVALFTTDEKGEANG